MVVLQICVTVAVLFAVSRVIILLRKRQISLPMAMFWIVVWTAALVSVFVPQVVNFFSALVGVQRGADLLVYASILALFYLIFRTNAKIDNTERKLTELVRQQAIKDEKK